MFGLFFSVLLAFLIERTACTTVVLAKNVQLYLLVYPVAGITHAGRKDDADDDVLSCHAAKIMLFVDIGERFVDYSY